MIPVDRLRPFLAALPSLLMGCAATYGTLHGVTWNERVATDQERSHVRVSRSGEVQRIYPGMGIQKDDEIATDSHTRVVLFLQAGYQVVVDTSTTIRIENPSIFVEIGVVLAKVVAAVREALTINSEFSTAAVEGTEFLFGVDRSKVVTITVLEGRVRAQQKDGRYPPAVYGPLQQGVLRPGQPPERMGEVSRPQAERLVEWARVAEGVVVVQVPDVRNLQLQEARALLERRGFKVLMTSQRATGQARPGTVIDQTPSPGAAARPEEYVSLTVEAESLLLPDVRRLSVRDAILRLEALGLRTRVSRPERRDTSAYRARAGGEIVEEQRPGAGARVAVGSTVELIAPRTIYQPPRPDTVPPPGPTMCTVPDVRRLEESPARSRLRSAGFSRVHVQSGTGKLVSFQVPSPGERVRCDTTVEIHIGTRIE
ncbi:MAG TPA: PASTA domain-containing protein [Gemmatimonadales bacterium]|nr:PASTA domain-containing protein [Gemmatimonadales bacterium]